DLRRWLNGEPVRARAVGVVERGWRWCRRNPAVALLTATVVVSLVVGLAVALALAEYAFREAANARTQGGLGHSRAADARANWEESIHRLYVSDLRLIQAHWENSQINLIEELLDRQHPDATGGLDLRGFEWYFWRRRCQGDLRTLRGHTLPIEKIAF